MRLHWPLRIAAPVATVLFLCGCPNPNAYTTPRTLNAGDLQWQIAAEGWGATINETVQNPGGVGVHTESASILTPTVPSFGIRYGVVDGFDLGVRLSNLDSLSVDGKIRLLKSTLDLAVDPGLQAFYLPVSGSDASNQTVSSNAGIFYFHLPVLVGINLSEKFSIVLSPGVTYVVATTTIASGTDQQQAAASTGLMARGGLGFDWRLTKKFAIHPEFTVLKSFGDNDALMYLFGIGFNIGAQPDYSDLAETEPAKAPARPAAEPGGS
jgi:hypothetical protein